MKLFLLAGEKSGDQHAGALARELSRKEFSLVGWGGEAMDSSGVSILKRYEDFAVMGVDFLKSLFHFIGLLKECKRQILHENPDAIVLIDYGGFNLRIAKWANKKGFKVIYFIPPKTWAWNASRNKKIRKYVNLCLVILPFEEEYYRSQGINAVYIGNPTKDFLAKHRTVSSDRSTIALLAGSRRGEVQRNMPLLKAIVDFFPNDHFTIAGLREIPEGYYSEAAKRSNVALVKDRTVEVLQASKAAVVCSGTATLEAALLEVPQVVIYKTSPLTYTIGRALVKVKYISLVNLLMDKVVVKEFIQDSFKISDICTELADLTQEETKRANQLKEYAELNLKLGEKNAAETAAGLIYEVLI